MRRFLLSTHPDDSDDLEVLSDEVSSAGVAATSSSTSDDMEKLALKMARCVARSSEVSLTRFATSGKENDGMK